MSHTGWTPREAAMMREKRRIEHELRQIDLTQPAAAAECRAVVRLYQIACLGLEDKIEQEEKP